MQDIKDLNKEELSALLKKWQEPVYHAGQILSWIYKKGAADFSRMSDLSLSLREKLKEGFYILGLKPVSTRKSEDDTEKLLFELKDGNLIESVIIPAKERTTGCVSTQVGCKSGCRFCASGMLGFKRNLSAGEILEEVLQMNTYILPGKLTHIVFMGIGEPLDNYDNVLKAIRIINSDYSFNIASRRITISSCGIIPGIRKLAKENLQVELSISLHAAEDKTRSELMPVNKKYPLKELMACLREYISETDRQVTFEYVLIRGLNADLQSAVSLSKILKPLKLCKVNLLPANPIEELGIEPPGKLEILFFRDYLLKKGINTTLRMPRGRDIEAACGQLRLRYEKK
ncbi:MAG: 23S rRNA (adenine(2503)-C(2))-methyltransferase RlmN [Candidatus Omnitrophica bacterium]|nr:23S rRNA (adenine(2503)-C(2))-methyltransferase RlmN [Candidatus Omnitrophota bacterium]